MRRTHEPTRQHENNRILKTTHQRIARRNMIPKTLQLIGSTLYLKKSKTLIIADLHLGAEEALVGRGILLPKTQKQELFQQLQKILSQVQPERVIINGDLKHEFNTINNDEWRDVLQLLTILQDYEVTVIKGNHDNFLQPILTKRNISLKDHIIIENWLVLHGDTLPKPQLIEQAQGIIIGHEHPSLLLDDGVRKEKYKCFAIGKYQHKQLIVLPSMYPLVEGSDILKEKALGPLFKEATHLEAYVVEGLETYYFGELNDIKTFK